MGEELCRWVLRAEDLLDAVLWACAEERRGVSGEGWLQDIRSELYSRRRLGPLEGVARLPGRKRDI